MSSLNIDQLKEILNSNKEVKEKYKSIQYDYFVETGTYYGTTTFAMQPYFKNIISIEIQQHCVNHCSNRLVQEGITNVKIYQGDSVQKLPEICESIKEPIIFFLDGHYSSDDTGKGEKDVPLLEELKIIDKRNNDDIIIIDDFRLFGTDSAEDWSDITTDNVLGCISDKRVFNHFDMNDRLCIFTRKV